jgi:hypothetical protein
VTRISSNRTTLALALALAIGLAGCGGSGGSSSQGTAPAARAAKTPAVDVSNTGAAKHAGNSHAQYLAFAAAVNLTPRDLPGFASKPKHSEHGSQLTNGLKDKAKYERCLGVGKEAKPIFKRSSEKFEASGPFRYLSAGSEVEVARTSALAEKALTLARRVFQSPTKRGCLAGAFDQMLGGSHTIHTAGHAVRITIGNARVAPVEVGSAVAGTGGGFGMSFSMNVTYRFSIRGRPIVIPRAMTIDVLGFIIGRAEVGLTTMALGESFPAEREASLFSLLVTRAIQASRQSPAITQ